MNTVTELKTDELGNSRSNPKKSNEIINRLSRAPWWLLAILSLVLVLVITVTDNNLYAEAWEDVQVGIGITVRVTLSAYSIALLLGLIIALLRRPSESIIYNIFVYQPVTFFVEIIRGIPTLVLLLYIVLALIPQGVDLGNNFGDYLIQEGYLFNGFAEFLATLRVRDVSFEVRAIVALAVSYSAFLSEVFRAGIESVDKGQREAAYSLGMSGWQVNRHIVLPQAIRNILPPLGNDFIAMLKESSLVSIVGVDDITRLARNFNSATFTIFPAYNIITMTYLMLTLTLSMFVKAIESYFGRSKQH
ncbi:MAG: amino acid ABC transporter permease [Phototrophicaceae bacterium]